ncbi:MULTISPECIES: hypothetical protein [Sphingomonas]|uniref:hypothetical protein n=1 Tax=Sphingomonas TaxID=13687 RepID=UPI001AE924C9
MDAFIAAGFTKRDVLDVATKVMSNHTNPIVHRISSVPLDARLVDVEIGDARRVELARGIVKGRLRIAVLHRER